MNFDGNLGQNRYSIGTKKSGVSKLLNPNIFNELWFGRLNPLVLNEMHVASWHEPMFMGLSRVHRMDSRGCLLLCTRPAGCPETGLIDLHSQLRPRVLQIPSIDLSIGPVEPWSKSTQ